MCADARSVLAEEDPYFLRAGLQVVADGDLFLGAFAYERRLAGSGLSEYGDENITFCWLVPISESPLVHFSWWFFRQLLSILCDRIVFRRW